MRNVKKQHSISSSKVKIQSKGIMLINYYISTRTGIMNQEDIIHVNILELFIMLRKDILDTNILDLSIS